MIWPSYLINLADNAVRLSNCSKQFARQKLNFERLDAINGWHLSAAEMASVYDTQANNRLGKYPLVPAEIGCYLSHLEAWRRIADGDAEGGFIFEDDFVANGQLGEVLRLLSEDTNDWDMVKLFSLDPSPKIVHRRPLGHAHEIVVPFRVPTCLLGYGLRREAARRLVDRALPFFRPVDEDQKFFWETGLKVALVTPPPLAIGDQQTVTGTIGNARRTAAKQNGRGRLAQTWHGLVYQLRYAARLYWHRLRGH